MKCLLLYNIYGLSAHNHLPPVILTVRKCPQTMPNIVDPAVQALEPLYQLPLFFGDFQVGVIPTIIYLEAGVGVAGQLGDVVVVGDLDLPCLVAINIDIIDACLEILGHVITVLMHRLLYILLIQPRHLHLYLLGHGMLHLLKEMRPAHGQGLRYFQ